MINNLNPVGTYWSPPEGRGKNPNPGIRHSKPDSQLTLSEYLVRYYKYPPELPEQLQKLKSLIAEHNVSLEQIEQLALADTTDNGLALHPFRFGLGVNTTQLRDLARYQRLLDSQPTYISRYWSPPEGRGKDPNPGIRHS